MTETNRIESLVIKELNRRGVFKNVDPENNEINWKFSFLRVLERVFHEPYFMLYGEVYAFTIDPCFGGEADLHGCTTGNQVAAMAMVVFLLVANILLLNILIAVFNSTYQNVMSNAISTWKFQRYQWVMQMENSSLLPPPFVILNQVQYLYKKIFQEEKFGKLDQGLKLFLEDEEVEVLQDFEEERVDDLQRIKFNQELAKNVEVEQERVTVEKLQTLIDQQYHVYECVEWLKLQNNFWMDQMNQNDEIVQKKLSDLLASKNKHRQSNVGLHSSATESLVNMQKLSESGVHGQQVSPQTEENREKFKNSKFFVESPKYHENRAKTLQNTLLNLSVSPPNNESENIPFYLGSGNNPAVFEETTPTQNSYLPMSSALSQAYRKRDQPYPRNLSNLNNNEYIMNTTADVHADHHGRHQHSVSYLPYNNRIFGGIFQKQKSCFTNFQNISAKKEKLMSVTKVKSLRRIKSLEFLISKNNKKRVQSEKFDQKSNENSDSQGKFRTAHRAAPDANFKALFFPREKWNATSNWVSQARNETKKIVNGVSTDDVFSDDLKVKSSSCKELHSLKFNKIEQHKVLTDNSGRSLMNVGGSVVSGSTMGQIKHFHRPIDEAGRVSFRDSFCGISADLETIKNLHIKASNSVKRRAKR